MKNQDPLYQQLLKACEELHQMMKYNETEQYWYWPSEVSDPVYNACGTCTNGARIIARKFSGYVAGYLIDFNIASKDLVAWDSCGHDFAIVGDYLVDWWAWEYDKSIDPPALHLVEDADLIAKKYKPQSEWSVFPANDFRIDDTQFAAQSRNTGQ